MRQKESAPAVARSALTQKVRTNLLRLFAIVVLVAVDLARFAILLTVDLRFFLRSQLAAIGGAVRLHFAIDLRFVIFQVSRFASGQLAALYALRDAVLLVLSPLADFALGSGILHRGIVLVFVD